MKKSLIYGMFINKKLFYIGYSTDISLTAQITKNEIIDNKYCYEIRNIETDLMTTHTWKYRILAETALDIDTIDFVKLDDDSSDEKLEELIKTKKPIFNVMNNPDYLNPEFRDFNIKKIWLKNEIKILLESEKAEIYETEPLVHINFRSDYVKYLKVRYEHALDIETKILDKFKTKYNDCVKIEGN